MIRETELISLKDGKTKSLTEFVQDLAPSPEPMDLTPSTPVDTGGADPVALSSYIDGIADTSASDAITAGLASGGSIKAAIDAAGSSQWTTAFYDFSLRETTLTETYQNVVVDNIYGSAIPDVTDKDYCIDMLLWYGMNGGTANKTLYFQVMGHMIPDMAYNIDFGNIIYDDPDIGITLNFTATVQKTTDPVTVKINKLTVKAKIDDASKNCKIVSFKTHILTR